MTETSNDAQRQAVERFIESANEHPELLHSIALDAAAALAAAQPERVARGALEGVLAGIMYDFLVSEGYHGHYPAAEEQAEKFAAQNAAAIREWLTSEAVVDAAARAVEGVEDAAASNLAWPECYDTARAALTAAVNADTEGDDL